MTVAAKCNITEFALQELNQLYYGFSCKTGKSAIIENYLEYLNCSNIKLIICNQAKVCAKDKPSVFNCNFNLISISATLNPVAGTDIIFDVKLVNYAGGTLPFSYSWDFDEDDFDLVGGTDAMSPEIKLALKPDKVIELLVSQITVEITDANGCTDSKSCWLIPDGEMRCGASYQSCNNPVGLTAVYNYVACEKPKTLVLTSISF